jgi:hypothetical protein
MPELVLRKCLDGKMRLKPIQGYDCIRFHWHNTPYIYSNCDVIQDGYYHDCEHMRAPEKCEHFRKKEETKQTPGALVANE